MQDAVTMREDTQASAAYGWSAHLQRRVMRLLLQHDQRLFRSTFRRFFAESKLPKIPLLQLYDRYLKLLPMGDELLDDIMPRIRRQLSLQTSQVSRQEEAPTHGEIDWQRTMERSMRELPGQLPLRFDTRQQQRSMTIAENVFVVAVLLHYRQALHTTLVEDLADEALSEYERQMLAGVEERVERELAAPYARALHEEAQQADIETLAEQVAAHMRPSMSPYRDLLAWWQEFTSLHIGRAFAERQFTFAGRRSDDKADAWLYELWIALELAHWLQQRESVTPDDVEISTDSLSFTFTWQQRRYRFRYNRQAATLAGHADGWENGPAVRPDYTIEREELREVTYQGKLVWREPPVVMDAKYYLQGSDPVFTHEPVKKMLGDMQLLGASQGVLYFPNVAEPMGEQQYTREIRPLGQRYSAQVSSWIRIYRLTPGMEFDRLQERLQDVLEYAIVGLPERAPVACHGIWLDADTINASRGRVPARNILCPKPHIGAEVFDLVSDTEHCLKDPRLCHVIGQPIVPPFVVRAATPDALSQQSSTLRTRSDELLRQMEAEGDEDSAEQLRHHIFIGVGRAVEQYVQLHGNTASLEEQYEQWIFGQYWKSHPRCLAEETRHILLSAAYVWDEYRRTSLQDWAAPAVQYCRALESEIKRRLYDHCPNAYKLPKNNPHLTLGAMKNIYKYRHSGDAQHNWGIFENLVKQSGSSIHDFTDTMQRMADEDVKEKRNQLAHGNPVPRDLAQSLRDTIIGKRDQPGVLYWLAENLQPK